MKTTADEVNNRLNVLPVKSLCEMTFATLGLATGHSPQRDLTTLVKTSKMLRTSSSMTFLRDRLNYLRSSIKLTILMQ